MMARKYDKSDGFRADWTGFIQNEVGYANKRRREVEARDHIIAIGYAERQIADTLKLVEKIKTEL